jgi:TM2 domain-containing membrane protein YozV
VPGQPTGLKSPALLEGEPAAGAYRVMPSVDAGEKASPPVREKRPLEFVALFLNILVLPGLGSIIGGRRWTGVAQLLLFLLGIPLTLLVIGTPMILSSWGWSLVTGLEMFQQRRIRAMGLILNIAVLPGLGSLLGGKRWEAALQLVLFLGAIVARMQIDEKILTSIVILGVWGWGIQTGLQILREASHEAPPP